MNAASGSNTDKMDCKVGNSVRSCLHCRFAAAILVVFWNFYCCEHLGPTTHYRKWHHRNYGTGVVFYFFTVIASLKSPDCPFQTPLSTVLQPFLIGVVAFGDHALMTGQEHPESWEGIPINMTSILKPHLKAERHVFAGAGAPFLSHEYQWL